MMSVNAGVNPQDTPPTVTNPAPNELLLRIPIAQVGETLNWLIGNDIPFELRFLQTRATESSGGISIS